MLRREQGELKWLKFLMTVCSHFDEKALILRVPALPCTGSGQGLETGVQKNDFGTRLLPLLGTLFRAFRHFVTFNFSFIFGVTADTEL